MKFIVAVVSLLATVAVGLKGPNRNLSARNSFAADAKPPMDPTFTNGVQQVIQGGKVLFEESFGQASKAYNVPMSKDVEFMIGSNSKLFTTVAIYQLSEQGLLNVDDDVASYLSEADFDAFGLPKVTSFCPKLRQSEECQVITFRQLMAMSSGLIDGFNCNYPPGSWELLYCQNSVDKFNYPGSLATIIGTWIQKPMATVPGATYHYVNENFILLSYFVEKLSGMSYREYIRTHIVDVVGLKQTYFDPWGQQLSMSNKLGVEYLEYSDMDRANWDGQSTVQPFASGVCSVELNPGYCSGTGGMISTSPDMLQWYAALFLQNFTSTVTSGSPLLTQASVDAILYPRTLAREEQDANGLWMYYAQGVVVSVEHADQAPPVNVFYQGGTICGHTSIVLNFDTGSEPPVFSTAFRNSVAVNMTKSQWDKLQTSVVGTGFGLLAPFDMYSDTSQLALDMNAYYSPAFGVHK